MKEEKSLYWKLCIIGTVVLSILTFTPLVIPMGTYRPSIGGVPRPLWAGILIYVLLVVVTYIGTRVYPGSDDDEEGEVTQ